MSDRGNSKDPTWTPDSEIVKAAVYAEKSDEIRAKAEEALFAAFNEDAIKVIPPQSHDVRKH